MANQASKSIKLSEILSEYIRKNQRLKFSTRKRRIKIWQMLLSAVGDMDISEFGYNEAEDFQEYLYSCNLGASSIVSYIKAVQSMMNWAWQRGYRQGDPFAGLKKPRIPKLEIRVYSKAELYDLLAAANDLWRARILTAVTAGLRRSEVLNLTINDIDFDRGLIKIQAKRQTAETWDYSTKSYECRRVAMTENLVNLLTNIIAELPPKQPYIMLTEKRYWHLQILRSRGQMTERMKVTPDENFWKPFRRILNTAGIKNGCFHDLRKTAITQWLLNGIAPQEVQNLAGHASIETTMTYYAACRSDITDRQRQVAII